MNGHLACKECILENLLAQKKEHTKQSNISLQHSHKLQSTLDGVEVDKHEKALELFEKTQSSVMDPQESKLNSKKKLPSFWVVSLTP